MPLRYPLNKRLLIPTLFCFIFFFMCGIVKGQPSDDIFWQTIETKHTVIRYQSSRDLKKFNARIKYRVETSGLKGLFSSSGPEDIEGTIIKKADALFEKAQQILDMRKKMKKVTINVYHDKKQLREAYQGIYIKPCNVRAWYEYRFHTIYMCIEDMHEGMLAHEMAHGIIDHYLLVRPPSATAEILARYVDSHLKK
jgi:hypothetical protein